MKKKFRLFELDALRGIAALGVCLFHFSMSNSSYLKLSIFKFGCTLVELFFIISGFVIFMSIENTKNVKDFFINRFIRLFPTYWISILVGLISLYLFGLNNPQLTSFKYLAGNFLMIQPVLRTQNFIDAYWTLYIELTFYFVIAFVAYIKQLKSIEIILFIGILFEFITTAYYAETLNTNKSFERFYIVTQGIFPLISYAHLFACGILFFKIWNQEKITILQSIILFLSFLCVPIGHTVVGRINGFINIYEHTICCLLFYLTFYLMVNGKLVFLNNKLLLFLGSISYSLYLVHESFGTELSDCLTKKIGYNLAATSGVLSSIVLASVIYFCFEKPLLSWRKAYVNKTRI